MDSWSICRTILTCQLIVARNSRKYLESWFSRKNELDILYEEYGISVSLKGRKNAHNVV